MIFEILVKKLIDNNITIGIAESCTGGTVSSRFVRVPGVSNVFLEGSVSYSVPAKIRTLGVSQETVDNYGVVSENVAREMASGIAKRCGSDVGIATTGYASPRFDNDSEFGDVCFGIYIKGNMYSYRFNFKGTRSDIIEQATEKIAMLLNEKLDMLLSEGLNQTS